MRKLSGVLLAACAMWQLGCAEPTKMGTTPAAKAPAGGAQTGSTTGGGAEVPTPATTPATEAPKTETPTPEAKPEGTTPAPGEPTPEVTPEKKAE